MTADVLILTVSQMEAEHLADIVAQFAALLVDADADDVAADPALARLVPDAYPDDAGAAREFRHATERELLDRRSEDARRVLAGLADHAGSRERSDRTPQEDDVVDLALDPEAARAWMRTLAAIRLVIASRMGITTEDDHDEQDPRYGVYDWLGYRLDGLIRALDGD